MEITTGILISMVGAIAATIATIVALEESHIKYKRAIILCFILLLVLLFWSQRNHFVCLMNQNTCSKATTPVKPDDKEKNNSLSSLKKEYNEGDIIKFGSWPVGAEAEEIEWEILEKKNDGTAIVLSSKVIDVKPYNTERKDITWAESSLRSWLNGEFYGKAFSPVEKDAIVETRLENNDNIGEFTQELVDYLKRWGVDGSSFLGQKWHTKGGEGTTDKIWLLSLDDMERYGRRFSTDESRIAKPMQYLTKNINFCPSEYCKKNGVVGNSWWWLRSPGYYQYHAAYVRPTM